MAIVTPRRLREAIAETLRDGMARVKIEAFLHEDLELPYPQPPGEYETYTKAAYVEAVLEDKSLAELVDMAMQVVEAVQYADELRELVHRVGTIGVAGELKNLIFAADGPKPRIVFRDAINNDIAVVENEQYCLVYDRPLGPGGLTWRDLTAWWADRERLPDGDDRSAGQSLYRRLSRSLANDAERRILRAYGQRYGTHGLDIPALIPQVYLHYDPYTRSQLGAAGGGLPRQRMDFLLLFPNRVRVVIECDGIQHYADPQTREADPQRYAEMVAEDRALRLRGYEVYRFGGQELVAGAQTESMLVSFFDGLAARHAPVAPAQRTVFGG